MFRLLSVLSFVGLSGMLIMTAAAFDADSEAKAFIQTHEERVKPLEKQANLAWWLANISGKDEDFKKKEEAQNRLDAVLAETEPFAKLKQLKQTPPKDPILAREIEVLYLQYLEKQVDKDLLKQMTAKSNAVEQAFNVFRAKVRGRELTDSEVRKVLKND